MKTEEIEALIADFEGEIRADEECPHVTDGHISTCTALRVSSALRFLLGERENLVHATSEGRLTQNGQLHSEQDWTKGTQWVHLKTRCIYTTVGKCRLEASGEPAVLYCGSEGTVWARAMDEFLDGRFDRLSAGDAPPQSQGDRPVSPPDEEVA